MTSIRSRQQPPTLLTVSGPVLAPRQINRTVLARQHLLDRADLDIPTVIEHAGGLQTQYAPSGYVGLWSRMAGFERAALTRALEDRSVVQGTLMRCTIHMVPAADYWPICAAIRTSRREWWIRIARSRGLTDIPHEAIADVLRAELVDGPRSATDLIAALQRAGHPKPLWEGAGLWLDMVRVPPSGTWERRRADLYGLADRWVTPVEISEADGLQLLLRRYLTAFGPAALADAATWTGVPRARLEPVAAAMDLTEYCDESGATLLDLPGVELTDPAAPAPIRFLPTWDAMLLTHCRRSGVLPEPLRSSIFHTKYPQSFGTVLVDGSVAATWTWRKDHVEVDELVTLKATARRQVKAESERLTAFYSG